MDDRCTVTTKAGAACKGRPYRDGLCRFHHPDLEANRRQGRTEGGRGKANQRRARKSLASEMLTMSEIGGLLSRTLTKLETGDIQPNVATAMAGVAKALVAIRDAGEIEERLTELEARLGIVDIDRRRTA